MHVEIFDTDIVQGGQSLRIIAMQYRAEYTVIEDMCRRNDALFDTAFPQMSPTMQERVSNPNYRTAVFALQRTE